MRRLTRKAKPAADRLVPDLADLIANGEIVRMVREFLDISNRQVYRAARAFLDDAIAGEKLKKSPEVVAPLPKSLAEADKIQREFLLAEKEWGRLERRALRALAEMARPRPDGTWPG